MPLKHLARHPALPEPVWEQLIVCATPGRGTGGSSEVLAGLLVANTAVPVERALALVRSFPVAQQRSLFARMFARGDVDAAQVTAMLGNRESAGVVTAALYGVPDPDGVVARWALAQRPDSVRVASAVFGRQDTPVDIRDEAAVVVASGPLGPGVREALRAYTRMRYVTDPSAGGALLARLRQTGQATQGKFPELDHVTDAPAVGTPRWLADPATSRQEILDWIGARNHASKWTRALGHAADPDGSLAVLAMALCPHPWVFNRVMKAGHLPIEVREQAVRALVQGTPAGGPSQRDWARRVEFNLLLQQAGPEFCKWALRAQRGSASTVVRLADRPFIDGDDIRAIEAWRTKIVSTPGGGVHTFLSERAWASWLATHPATPADMREVALNGFAKHWSMPLEVQAACRLLQPDDRSTWAAVGDLWSVKSLQHLGLETPAARLVEASLDRLLPAITTREAAAVLCKLMSDFDGTLADLFTVVEVTACAEP